MIVDHPYAFLSIAVLVCLVLVIAGINICDGLKNLKHHRRIRRECKRPDQ